MRYVIIGAGVAGFAAVEAIRTVDQAGEIIMVSDDPHGYYSRPGLAYYLTGEVHDKTLYPRTEEDYKKLKFSFHKRPRDANCAFRTCLGNGWKITIALRQIVDRRWRARSAVGCSWSQA